MRREISTKEAVTLFGLFRLRVKYSPDRTAFKYFDKSKKRWISSSWRETALDVAKWQAGLKKENLTKGDRVGLMIKTSYERAIFEFAASGLGLVTVPMPVNGFASKDYNESVILDLGIKFLLIEGEEQEKLLLSIRDNSSSIADIYEFFKNIKLVRLDQINSWLPRTDEEKSFELIDITSNPDDIAVIHYTSGTSGKPKGVVLSYKNLLSNAEAISHHTTVYDDDILVPFASGWLFPIMADCGTAFPRNIYDLKVIKPTRIVSATRLYEYLYDQINSKLMKKPLWVQSIFKYAVKTGWNLFEYRQGRGDWHFDFLLFPIFDLLIARPVRKILGNRVRSASYAGGVLPPEIYKTFIAFGIPVLNCYGQAEAGPIVSINVVENNIPSSVGKPLKTVDIMIKNGELLVKSPSVMTGYWNNQSATEAALKDGWLHTGDMVNIGSNGYLFFVGRMSEVITMENGKKVSPVAIEAVIKADILFDQVMVIGKDRPFLTALVIFNKELLEKIAKSLKLNPRNPLTLREKSLKAIILKRIAEKMADYPDYMQIVDVTLLSDEWTAESGLMTVSNKLKRKNIEAKYSEEINTMYYNA
ncbi:MAG: AMP-binding protein [Desulfamplus sp.]|nr:AMP-binding protein [Desulfamplus sp.]